MCEMAYSPVMSLRFVRPWVIFMSVGVVGVVTVLKTFCIRSMPAAIFEVILLTIIVVAPRAGHFEATFISGINAM